MPDIESALQEIARNRSRDPLRPVTVVTPSHAAALQLRRRLARIGPFAAVRFETLPRIAELLASGSLTRDGKSPLARPIGDYLAGEIAVGSGAGLRQVSDMPGYARTLRRIFTRLRRAGVKSQSDVTRVVPGEHFTEILRLYESFRRASAAFYDVEDLLEAAAAEVQAGTAGSLADLGSIYVVPPGAMTCAGVSLMDSLAGAGLQVTQLDEQGDPEEVLFRIAPDPATEVSDIARCVLNDLESGASIDEIAVFHGGGDAYPGLLREAFQRAGIPASPLPGIPLIQTRLGKSVLHLAELPAQDYSRTALMDMLSTAPLRHVIPATDGEVRPRETSWDRTSREAGVTHGKDTWSDRLDLLVSLAESERRHLATMGVEYEGRARSWEYRGRDAKELRGVISVLIERMEPLLAVQPAEQFITHFKGLLRAYVDDRDDDWDVVMDEVDQLGSVGAVGGSFSLTTFTRSLRANLELAYRRSGKLGTGVTLAHYNAAAGLMFKHVYLCGAYEGAFPAGPGRDALLDDRTWSAVKSIFPQTEDMATRIDRERLAVARAVAAGKGGAVTWSCPAYESGGGRDYYPSPEMVHAHNKVGGSATAARLRSGQLNDAVRVHRHTSPLAATLTGPVLDGPELAVRRAIHLRSHGDTPGSGHRRFRPYTLLRQRRQPRFTEWDGNIGPGLVSIASRPLSPTSLEDYADCGYRFFAKRILYLRGLDEPEDLETLSPLDRGSLVHSALERFFKLQRERGRPAVEERWTDADAAELLAIVDEEFRSLEAQGKTGVPVYSEHDLRAIKADLIGFLGEDSEFRISTGAIPTEFEGSVSSEVAGVRLRGKYDRLDRRPDGSAAWVIDYKTGRSHGFDNFGKDPFVSGTKLQLATYAYDMTDADTVNALYWFISAKEDFKRLETTIGETERKRLSEVISRIVQGAEKGLFPAFSGEYSDYTGTFDRCGYCDFHRLCDIRRDRAFAQMESDPLIQEWRAVGALEDDSS